MLHLNTYVMGLRLLYFFNSFSAGIDFRRLERVKALNYIISLDE